MTIAKTVEVEVDVSDVDCDECSKKAKRAYCSACFNDVVDDAGDKAIENYSPPEDETRADNAGAVRGWLDRERFKPTTDITPEIAAIIERCAEDLEVG